MAELDPNLLLPLKLGKDHLDQIISLAQSGLPEEVCGIIAGKDRSSQKVFPVTNILASPSKYRMDPAELVNTIWKISEERLETVAFFHSHPHSPPIPSLTDLQAHLYPEIPQIIVGQPADQWIVKAYFLSTDSYQEIPLLIT